MKTVYFIRHGKRDTGVKNDIEAPLTKEGQNSVNYLPVLFQEKVIGNIYSSPFLRATQSVTPIADSYKKDIILIDEFRERDVGEWVLNFQAYSQRQWSDWTYKLDKGESLLEVKERVVPMFNKLFELNTMDFLISGHGTMLSVLFNEFTKGSFGYKEFNEMRMPEVYCAVFDEDRNLLSFKVMK